MPVRGVTLRGSNSVCSGCKGNTGLTWSTTRVSVLLQCGYMLLRAHSVALTAFSHFPLAENITGRVLREVEFNCQSPDILVGTSGTGIA